MNHIVYLLTDKNNGLIYIGQTCGKLHRRWNRSRLIERFGHDNFDKEILFSHLDEEGAWWYECAMIDEYDSTNPLIGYNIYPGGGIITEEVKKKMSDAHRGEKNYWFGKRGKDNPNYGSKRSEETKKKMSDAHKRKTFSEDTKKKISESKTGKDGMKGMDNPMFGKKHSADARKKMSNAISRRGGISGESNPFFEKEHSEETKRKMSKKQSGENNSNSKLTIDDVKEIRIRANKGENYKSIAKDYDVSNVSVYNIIKRKSWKNID